MISLFFKALCACSILAIFGTAVVDVVLTISGVGVSLEDIFKAYVIAFACGVIGVIGGAL